MKLPPTTDGKHWILWDGACGFCRRSVASVMRRDRRGQFRAIPYQEVPSPPMTPELAQACNRSVHVICADGTLLRAERAILFILEQFGWGPLARLLGLPPFGWIMAWGYRLVADHRMFFSRFLFTR